MNSTRILGFLCALAISTAVAPAFSDSVKKGDGTWLQGPIRQMNQEGVTLDDNPIIAWTNIAAVRIDRTPLKAPGQRLILRDGTTLCGIVSRMTRDAVTFRSITAGTLRVDWDHLTAIRYGEDSSFPEAIKGAKGELTLVQNDAERIQGQLVTSTERTLLLRTADGMRKTATEEMAWLVAYPTVTPARDLILLLRNGDRLNGPVVWKNNEFSVMINGRTLNMDQAAIRGIVNPGAAIKDKD